MYTVQIDIFAQVFNYETTSKFFIGVLYVIVDTRNSWRRVGLYLLYHPWARQLSLDVPTDAIKLPWSGHDEMDTLYRTQNVTSLTTTVGNTERNMRNFPTVALILFYLPQKTS